MDTWSIPNISTHSKFAELKSSIPSTIQIQLIWIPVFYLDCQVLLAFIPPYLLSFTFQTLTFIALSFTFIYVSCSLLLSLSKYIQILICVFHYSKTQRNLSSSSLRILPSHLWSLRSIHHLHIRRLITTWLANLLNLALISWFST